MELKTNTKRQPVRHSALPGTSNPTARGRSSGPRNAGAASALLQGDPAQNRSAPMLPTSLCSLTKISKYW